MNGIWAIQILRGHQRGGGGWCLNDHTSKTATRWGGGDWWLIGQTLEMDTWGGGGVHRRGQNGPRGFWMVPNCCWCCHNTKILSCQFGQMGKSFLIFLPEMKGVASLRNFWLFPLLWYLIQDILFWVVTRGFILWWEVAEVVQQLESCETRDRASSAIFSQTRSLLVFPQQVTGDTQQSYHNDGCWEKNE